ncbi:MAG: YidH family protein [Solirubrobacterales bacterium]
MANGVEDGGATRRTHLAAERTQLAWWRTGLTAIAVALAVGRVVPELSDNSLQWPYTVVGCGFALYGIALIAYGTLRARAVESAIAAGTFATRPDRLLGGLTAAGVLLGIATLVLVAVD